MPTARSVIETVGKEMLMPFISDIIALGFLGKKDGGRIIKDPEQAKALARRIAPHLFGLGLSDEALFNSTLSKLEDGRQKEISRFLDPLSESDRARFILAIAILPEEKDRIEILKMYSEIDTIEEMEKLAKATGFITKGESTFEKLAAKTKVMAILIAGKMVTIFVPVLKDLDETFENAADVITGWTGNETQPSTSRVVRFADKIFR